MQIDLWQRRLGWLSLVGIILFSGALAQSRFAAAEDGGNVPQPPTPPATPNVVYETQEIEVPGGTPDKPKKVQIVRERVIDQTAPKLYAIAKLLAGGENGKFWIGVESLEAEPNLRAQLGLDDGQGLVVVHVAEDSPAAKAGIKQHDVIVSAGEGKLRQPQDLAKAVEVSDGKELSLKLIRTGKEQVVQITPAERPKDPVQFLARPGMGMVFGNVAPGPLPDNVSISVSRSGNKPAKINVSRGDEKWDISDQELNKLPDDLRPFVERMLGGGPMAIDVQGLPNKINAQGTIRYWPQLRIDGQVQGAAPPTTYYAPAVPNQPGAAPAPTAVPATPGQPPAVAPRGPAWLPHAQASPPDVSGDLIKRLDELDRQLRQLQDELRRVRDHEPNPPREPRGPAPPPQPGVN
jgi:membrane-associated protease RseP (regulator of RpoE activity)